jgi:hypothetical protein
MAVDLSRVTDLATVVNEPRWSMAGDLNLGMVVAVTRTSMDPVVVEEPRWSMAGDLNQDTVVAVLRPGMVKRGASMNESQAMEDLKKGKKEATGSLAMEDLMIRLKAT